MDANAPLEPPLEPMRRTSPLGSRLAIGLLAFAGGVAAMAGAAWVYGGGSEPAALPDPVQQPAQAPHAAPAPVQPPATDVATLSAREAELAGRLDALEAKLRDTEQGADDAAGYAVQAERLMIAFAARRAIERGLPLGPVEGQLRRRFGERNAEAVGTVIQAAQQPVTIEDLRLALETIAPRLGAAADESWWAGFSRVMGDLVVVRESGSPSPRPADRLRRVRRALDMGQVEAALAEIAHMPGAAEAESWTAAARRYIAAREALRTIEAAAMETPPAR